MSQLTPLRSLFILIKDLIGLIAAWLVDRAQVCSAGGLRVPAPVWTNTQSLKITKENVLPL